MLTLLDIRHSLLSVYSELYCTHLVCCTMYYLCTYDVFDYHDAVWFTIMNQLKIMERLHFKVTFCVFYIKKNFFSVAICFINFAM